jgi:hypothetical protein
MVTERAAHKAAVDALLSDAERAEYALRMQALRSRNALLTMLDSVAAARRLDATAQ